MELDQILIKLNVSRETLSILNKYKELVISENNKINLISAKSASEFAERHIIDCAQAIDFIDKNSKICTDLGTGAGLPGIVLAILLRERNIDIKMNLYEKRYRKSIFLKSVSRELKLETEIFQRDVFSEKNLVTGTILARAFKPLPELLKIIDKNFKKISSVVIFMGESGANILKQTSKNWKFDFIHRKSITNKKSFIIKLKNLKRI